MSRRVVDFTKNALGHDDTASPFNLPAGASPNCRGCHIDTTGKIAKRLGMGRVITSGTAAGWNIYRQQGGHGLFRLQSEKLGDTYNILWKQEGATAADGAGTHGHLYKYTTGTTVTKLTGVEHIPPVKENAQAVQIGDDLFLGFPTDLDVGPGTVTTNGTTTVTCSASYFTTAYGAVVGYLMLIEGETQWHEVSVIGGATSITLSSAATTSGAGKRYCIAPRGGIKLEGNDTSLTPRWVGIKAPATAAGATEADTGGSITSAVDGTYRFRYTYMNDAKHESAMSPVPAAGVAVTGTNTTKVTVTMTAISPTDSQVVKYRLYADKDGSGNYNFVKEGTWATSITVTTDAELTLDGERPGPTKNDAPLFCCAQFAVWQRRLCGIGDPLHPNWMYFTEQGEDNVEGFPINLRTSEHWHAEFTNAPKLTAITEMDGRLIVFGEREVYQVAGRGRYVTDDYNAPTGTDMTPVRLCAETGVGCVAADTLVDVNGQRWFLTHRGVYRLGAACPAKVTDALDETMKVVNWDYAYRATATLDVENDEYVLSLPVDSSTTNNLTIRINVLTAAVMLDDCAMQCVRTVKDEEVHVLTHEGVVQKWETAATYTDGILGVAGTCAAGCSATSLVATGVFTSYTASWGTLAGSPVIMTSGTYAGEVGEILDVDDADTCTLRVGWSGSPAAGDTFVIGGINFLYEFPWIRNERREVRQIARLHLLRLFLDQQATGAHTLVAGRTANTPTEDATWSENTQTTAAVDMKEAPIGLWGRYFQARVRNYYPAEHVVVSGASVELSP